MIKHIPTNRLSIRIATAIKREIASGALRAGDRLPAERAMALRYGVSRVSVREAYRALQDAGVVAVRRGSAGGAFIVAPPASRIGESLALALRLGGEAPDRQAREARMIEPLVAALAARHATPAGLSRLRKLADATAPSARARRFEAHRLRFHLAVADCARNVVLSAAVASLAGFPETADEGAVPVDHVEGVRRWQGLIIDAIAVRDEVAANRRMRAYLLWLDERRATRPAAPTPDVAARTTSAA